MDSSSTTTSAVLAYADPQPPRRTLTRVFASPWILLPTIILVAAALRWFHIDYDSFWLDEFLAVQNSTGRGQAHMTLPNSQVVDPAPHLTRMSDGPGLWHIWSSLRTETHPPLYFVALNVWRNIFGDSDAAARGLSAFMGILVILLAFDVARLLHGRAVALWVALIAAVAGPQIQYAAEARSYTMVIALMLTAADALVRIEKLGVNRKRLLSLGAAVLAMPLTHYLSVFVAGALFVYAMIRLHGRARVITAATFAIAAVIFAVAWGPMMLEQSRGWGHEHAWQSEFSGTRREHFLLTLRRLALLPLRYFTEPMKRSLDTGQLAAVLYVIPLLLLFVKKRRDLLLWCLLAMAAIVPVVASDLARGASTLALVRYTLLASVPAYAIVAAMLSDSTGFLRHAIPLTVTIACLLAIEEPYSNRKADSRELARFVAQHVQPDDIMVIYRESPIDWLAPAMYLGLSHYGAPRCPIIFLTEPPNAAIVARLRQANSVWLMSPTLAIPNERLFPASHAGRSAFFPWIGTVAQVRMAG